MGSRLQTVLWIGLMAALALLLPLGLGQLFTAWRADVEKDLSSSVPPAAPTPTLAPVPDPVPERVPNLRPVDTVLLAFGERADQMKSKTDVRPSEPYRIDFEREAGGPLRASVDLDRNGRFDERWTYGASLVREVSPADDGIWRERYGWDGYDWVRVETP